MKENFRETLKTILTEMCQRVGADYATIDFQDEKWYHRYEWTQDEDIDFQKWLVDYLYNNTKARNEVMSVPIKRKSHLKKFANWFTFMYGWKYKKIENIDIK